MLGYLQLLRRNPQFARLWIAQAISLFGDWFATIALSTLVTAYSDKPGLAVSGLLLARSLPPLLVGPLAGVLIDRLNRKHLLILSDVLRAVVVLLLMLVEGPALLWLVYPLVVFQFCLSALFEPGRSALLPSVVQREDLVQANTLGSITWSAMLAIGAVVGGAVASWLGTKAALAIDGATFLLSALFIASIRVAATPDNVQAGERAEGHGVNFLADLREGLRYIRRHPTTGIVLLVKAGGAIGSADALMVIYATQLFIVGQGGSGSLGLLYGFFGIGAILGPILTNRVNDGSVRRMRRLIIVAYLLIALGWFGYAGAAVLALAALTMMVKAMGSSVYWTYSSVILQKSVPDHFLGRLFSLDLAAFQLMTTLSTVATGWALDFSGLEVRQVVYWTGAISLMPLTLWALAVPWAERRELRDAIQPDAPVPAVGD